MDRKSGFYVICSTVAAAFLLSLAVGCDYDENGKTKEPHWQATNVQPFVASGSTFIAPLITRWGSDYEKSHPVHVNYQPIGSGGGIENLRHGVGAFVASDAPLSDDQLKGLPAIVQIPVTAGPVCIIYNMPGLKEPLRFSGTTVAGIFGGDIISWQDAAIARDNPGVKLPHAAIIVVHRSDGSGTTSILTNYLSRVSPSWSKKLGSGLAVQWPAGIGGEGSRGVLFAVKHNPGTIGYLELNYARDANVAFASIQNRAGEWVVPTPQSAYLAVTAGTEMLAQDVRTPIVDPPSSAKGAYPITGLSYILIPKDNQEPGPEQQLLKGYIEYALSTGQDVSEQLSYAKLPSSVQKQGEAALAQLTQNGQPIK